MSSTSALSMQELEMESAELLPGRETLCVTSYHPGGGSAWGPGGGHGFGGGFSQTTTNNIGNTAQGGLLNVALLNGSLNNLNVGGIHL